MSMKKYLVRMNQRADFVKKAIESQESSEEDSLDIDLTPQDHFENWDLEELIAKLSDINFIKQWLITIEDVEDVNIEQIEKELESLKDKLSLIYDLANGRLYDVARDLEYIADDIIDETDF